MVELYAVRDGRSTGENYTQRVTLEIFLEYVAVLIFVDVKLYSTIVTRVRMSGFNMVIQLKGGAKLLLPGNRLGVNY